MYLISADGRLLPKTLLCQQEASGRFGETVMKNLYQPHNIALTCTRSGLFTHSTLKYWVENTLSEFIPRDKKSLLLIDSWAPHRNKENYDCISERPFHIKVIPAQTTALAQPLDVYFNRRVKQLIRFVTNQVRATVVSGGALDRNSVISIMSLAQFVLSAPCFRPMITYALKKSGYVDTYELFSTVLEICRIRNSKECDIPHCSLMSCFRCPWCDSTYCIRCMISMRGQPHMNSCIGY